MENPALSHLWDDKALVEVDVTADLPDLGRIHGTIDRLIVTPDHVLVVDYKSNRLVPGKPDETPLGVLKQLAAYEAALRQIYPDRPIDTAILWTQTAELMMIPAPVLHEALNSVTVA